jgi:hypothetical protein
VTWTTKTRLRVRLASSAGRYTEGVVNVTRQEARRLAAALGIAALALDFTYSAVYWLHGMRPHRFRRYIAIVALMSAEAVAIHRLVKGMR